MASSFNQLSSAKRTLAAGRPVPFSYNHEAKTFSFGNEIVDSKDIPRYGTPFSVSDTQLADEIVDEMFENEPLVYTYYSPLSLPPFQEFIRTEWSDELAAETTQVMADVMSNETRDMFSWMGTESLEAVGYKALHIRSTRDAYNGRIHLGVPGDCACCGPDATTHRWGSKYWDMGIMEYTYHNIDRSTQLVALMAGLGHLAFRAKQSLTEDGS